MRRLNRRRGESRRNPNPSEPPSGGFLIGEIAMPDELKMSSLYRTRWLMAHNRLHEIVYEDEPKISLARHWDEYLAELRTAECVASKPA